MSPETWAAINTWGLIIGLPLGVIMVGGFLLGKKLGWWE